MPLRTIADETAPHLLTLSPRAALPGGVVEVTGTNLGAATTSAALPTAALDDQPAHLALSRAHRAIVTVPDDATGANLHIIRDGVRSNGLPLAIATPLLEDIHPVGSPAVDADGSLYVMNSGPRGEQVEISIYRVQRDFAVRPFLRDLLNISALAFDRDGFLFASSRAEGTVYRIAPDGSASIYAEGMGIATGLAFDREGNLFVGDRSGTIFKIARGEDGQAGETFVFATLEPSVAAYHLAFRDDGTLLVTAPTTTTNGCIYSISPEGATSVFYRGLGRPQGLAVCDNGNVYVAASLHGKRGIICINDDGNAQVVVAGNDLVGICFVEDGIAALTTRTALLHVDLGIEGRRLV